MTNHKRLFFGNPTRDIDLKPLPKGKRLAFGEPGMEPANPPQISPNHTVLAYGNHPERPHREVPFVVRDGQVVLSRDPRSEDAL